MGRLRLARDKGRRRIMHGMCLEQPCPLSATLLDYYALEGWRGATSTRKHGTRADRYGSDNGVDPSELRVWDNVGRLPRFSHF